VGKYWLRLPTILLGRGLLPVGDLQTDFGRLRQPAVGKQHCDVPLIAELTKLLNCKIGQVDRGQCYFRYPLALIQIADMLPLNQDLTNTTVTSLQKSRSLPICHQQYHQ
jgi:hypothetical protein